MTESADTLTTHAPRERAGIRRGFSSLANPQFRLLWFGVLFSQGAMQINIVARSWLAYEISGSSTALGLVAVASGIPMALFSLIAGALVDRADKKRMLLIVQTCLAVLAAATAVLVHAGLITVWQLAVVGLLQGAVFAFNFPTRQSIIPALVRDEEISNAITMNSTGLNLNRVAGPSVAGLLIGLDPALAFDVIAILYGIGVLMLFRLPPLRAPARIGGGPLKDMVAGFSYVKNARTVRSLLLLALIPTVLGMPFQQFLPVFQKDVLDVSASALGLMFTAVGVGSLIGSLSVAYVPEHRAQAFQLVTGFLFGVALVGFAVSTTLPMALLTLAAVGLTSQAYFVMNNVLLMASTDREYYGRMMSIYMLTWSVQPVAVYPMGIIIDEIGMPITQAAVGAILAVFVAIVIVFRRPGRPRPVPA